MVGISKLLNRLVLLHVTRRLAASTMRQHMRRERGTSTRHVAGSREINEAFVRHREPVSRGEAECGKSVGGAKSRNVARLTIDLALGRAKWHCRR